MHLSDDFDDDDDYHSLNVSIIQLKIVVFFLFTFATIKYSCQRRKLHIRRFGTDAIHSCIHFFQIKLISAAVKWSWHRKF